jgi:hypothetical protein
MATNRDDAGAATSAPEPTVDPSAPPSPAPARQCSRCRASFPADDTLLFTAEHAWWLCPACRDALLGRPAR